LDFYKIKLDGKKVAVLGRSILVGRAVALLADKRGATITQIHSHTKTISKITREANIIISAIGKPNFIKKNFVKKGQVIIDVGTTPIIKKGVRKLCGDVDFKNVSRIVRAISPVPGGVGPMTVLSLFENLLRE
jgi:5,10-methylene-tetrahydrofolate dehydrogenase/methenyl tetrahydrofolate cyclohydrolase